MKCNNNILEQIAETNEFILKEPTINETSIIFDWDDTLLCSSWLSSKGLDIYSDILNEDKLLLDDYANSVYNILETALSCGTVTIITNAQIGWVEISCKKFIPCVSHILDRIKIISARSTFEKIYPDSPGIWKELAFAHEIALQYSDHKLQSRKNLISLGDSIYERLAIHKYGEMCKANYIKSVKFVENPTIEQLKYQIKHINFYLVEICKRTEHLDLMLIIEFINSKN